MLFLVLRFFEVLILVVIVVVFMMIIIIVLGIDFYYLVDKLVVLFVEVGDSLVGVLILVFLIMFFWLFGIYGVFVVGIVVWFVWEVYLVKNVEVVVDGVFIFLYIVFEMFF